MSGKHLAFLIVACACLCSCRPKVDSRSSTALTRQELTVLERFKTLNKDDREKVGKDVAEILHGLRSRLEGAESHILIRSSLESYLGEPHRVETNAAQTSLVYQVRKTGGARKYLVVVLLHDVFATTEPMWSVE